MVDGTARRGMPWSAAAALSVALSAVCACTDQTKVQEGQLTQLLATLPGRYDNSAQVEQDARNGVRPAHDAVVLTITHVYTPRLGHYVYYVQETAADNPLRVFSQRMWSFQVDEKRRGAEKGGIVETIYEFVEPQRWRDGLQNKDLFTSIVIEDVQAQGCLLLWKKKEDGFVATHDQKACPDPGGVAKPQAELAGGVLTIGEYKFRKAR
jgi:CpeT/CpcT family (DUF1001)